MAKRKEYDWRQVDRVWEEDNFRAPTLRRPQPKRQKTKTKSRAPEVPKDGASNNDEFGVTIPPYAGTSQSNQRDFPVVIYHPLTEKMEDRQRDMLERERALREAERRAAERAEEDRRMANNGFRQQMQTMPATIFEQAKSNWIWILLLLLVVTVGIMAYIIGKQNIGLHKRFTNN